MGSVNERIDEVGMYLYCYEKGKRPEDLTENERKSFEVSDKQLEKIRQRNRAAYELLRKVQN